MNRCLRSVALALTLCSAYLPSAQAACEAASLIAMRTEMMVAAISCRATSGYNAALRKHKATFLAAQREVVAEAGSMSSYDSWITELANERGLARGREGDGYCGHAVSILPKAVQAKSAAALRAVASTLSIPYPQVGACARRES